MDVADKFEKSDNKGTIFIKFSIIYILSCQQRCLTRSCASFPSVPIAAWSAAAFFAITTAEWFIHLPLFDFLLGFPIQFLGLITAANYSLKFYKGERIDLVDELEGVSCSPLIYYR